MDSTDTTGRIVTRRTVLGSVGAVCLGAVAGCLDGEEASVPDAIEVDDDHDCDNCTMRIGGHAGPAGQTHYEDPTEILDEDRPARFCSSLCTYAFTFDNEAEAEPTVVYLTDYSAVDYEIQEDEDGLVATRHLEADAFGDAAGLTLVADSEVGGAMGASLVPFSNADEAAEFQADYGGEIYDHDEVTQDLVMSLM
ncbi:nitrous oxide reductase accessory protein NosL [Natronorubrum sp. JWXQ-INN-674]|uniref:Nitrous oxide reductase accessory protein NosL n=1 Tax=Natronorubrum halalkaliphilum TaxID=2691917 RepID=A0A6B0VRY0_9EURY|nr:nitrous oxide reductase accessory protein NosL [Natronorubrum halalkaliphilum]MXV63532.1 nitrous oxide reductase accessory protein NosL [Natronorubrum halalkaliphilum]